jgi:hypothetical protein
MRLVARWGVAVVGSVAEFALAWWVCQEQVRLDEGVSLGVAGAVLAVAAWWAPRGADSGESGGGARWLVQKARAGRDLNMAARDIRRLSVTGAGMSDR